MLVTILCIGLQSRFFFFFKFFKQVHQLGSSTSISNKQRLSWWTSRFFLESCLTLATYNNTLFKFSNFQFFFPQDMGIFFLIPKIPFVRFTNLFCWYGENSPQKKQWLQYVVTFIGYLRLLLCYHLCFTQSQCCYSTHMW